MVKYVMCTPALTYFIVQYAMTEHVVRPCVRHIGPEPAYTGLYH